MSVQVVQTIQKSKTLQVPTKGLPKGIIPNPPIPKKYHILSPHIHKDKHNLELVHQEEKKTPGLTPTLYNNHLRDKD